MDVKFVPKKSKAGGYYVPSTSLPPMISSVEAKLGLYNHSLPPSLPPSMQALLSFNTVVCW